MLSGIVEGFSNEAEELGSKEALALIFDIIEHGTGAKRQLDIWREKGDVRGVVGEMVERLKEEVCIGAYASRLMKGVVSAGHDLTARAAVEMLEAGGNAFDAAVAASFASFVTEAALTSAAGGGFMMTHESGGDVSLYDFFVDVPGLGRGEDKKELNFFSIFIDFANVSQELHVGEGSAAVPGNIAGLAEVFKDHCTLPLADIMAPAIRYAGEMG